MKKIKYLTQEECFDLFQKFIKDSYKGTRSKKDGQRIRSQSVDNYSYTLKHLQKFCEETGFELKICLVNKLNANEVQKVKKYWMNFYNKFTEYLYKQGHFDNYVGFSIKNIRAYFNYLQQEQQLQVGAFHKLFYVPKEEIPIVVLSPEQLNYLIHNKELNEKLPEDLKITKDLFVFGCTVALRVSDLMSLKPFHLTKQGEQAYLKVRSQKTGVETSVKLPAYAIEILKKYEGKQKTLLPSFSKGYFNRQLKRFGTYITDEAPMIKIRTRRGKQVVVYKDEAEQKHFTMADHITTHTMRRTAITTLLRLNMPEQLVRKISGHAAHSKEFYKYVAFSQTQLDKETDKVFELLCDL